MLLLLFLCTQACGIEAVIIYLPQLLSDATSIGQEKNIYLVAIFIGLVKIAVSAFAMAFVDKRSGRKPMLLVSGAGMAVCMLAIGIEYQLQNDLATRCVLVSLYMASYSLGYGPIGWVLVSEVFPLQV